MNVRKTSYSRLAVVTAALFAIVVGLRGIYSIHTGEYVLSPKYSPAVTLHGTKAVWRGAGDLGVAMSVLVMCLIEIGIRKWICIIASVTFALAAVGCYVASFL